MDIDATERQWTEIAPKSVVKDLEKKEIKRQQIINELMSTEQHHVRDLKIIEQVTLVAYVANVAGIERKKSTTFTWVAALY